MHRALLLILAVGLVATAGCGDDDPVATGGGTSTSSPPGGTADLDGRMYASTSVVGHELVAGSSITLGFADGRVSANGGCNTIGGSYEAGTELRVDPNMASTMMGCEAALEAQDQWLTAFLTSNPTVTVDGDTLTLSSGDVTITLVDQASPSGATPLVGTLWTLDTIIDGTTQSASSVPAGVQAPTLQIGEDGRAAVFTGCNRGNAGVSVDGSTLSFEPLALTKMACIGDASTVEAAVVAVLEADVEFTIVGESLTLTKGANGLGYRAA
jgi:heat shock protein HslJ